MMDMAPEPRLAQALTHRLAEQHSPPKTPNCAPFIVNLTSNLVSRILPEALPVALRRYHQTPTTGRYSGWLTVDSITGEANVSLSNVSRLLNDCSDIHSKASTRPFRGEV